MADGLHSDKAIAWVCTREYLPEMLGSAERAARYAPEADRILVTDSDFTHPLLSNVLRARRQSDNWYLDSVRWWNYLQTLGYDRMLVLDTDAWLIHGIEPLWALLDQFDIAGAHAPARQTAPARHAPEPFCELNVGAILFRSNDRTRKLFELWRVLFEANEATYGQNDQAPLRDALWMSAGEVRAYVLPPEWNCRFGFGGYAAGAVRIIHGRVLADVAEQGINRLRGMRTWPRTALTLREAMELDQ